MNNSILNGNHFLSWTDGNLTSEIVRSMEANMALSAISRVCLHDSESSLLHVMLIAIPPFTIYPIHRHLTRDEWYLVVRGRLLVGFYDDDGYETRKVELSPPSEITTQRLHGLLVNHMTYHSTSTDIEGALFLEIRPGPFQRSDTQFFVH